MIHTVYKEIQGRSEIRRYPGKDNYRKTMKERQREEQETSEDEQSDAFVSRYVHAALEFGLSFAGWDDTPPDLVRTRPQN